MYSAVDWDLRKVYTVHAHIEESKSPALYFNLCHVFCWELPLKRLSIIHVMWQSTYVTHTYVHPIYVYCNSTHKHVAIHTQSTYTRRSCDVHGNKSPLLHLPFPLTPPIAGNGNGSTTGRLHWMSLSSQAGTSLWPHWGVTLTPSLNSELKTIKVEKVGTLVLDQWWDCTSLSYKEVYCNLKWTNKQHLCPKEDQSILQLKRDSI